MFTGTKYNWHAQIDFGVKTKAIPGMDQQLNCLRFRNNIKLKLISIDSN